MLGRVNYQGFFSYWPSVSKNPSSTKKDVDFSRWLNSVQKIVFSRTLSTAEWENSRLVRSIEHHEITKLKQSHGSDIVTLNSASIAQALMRMGLIDEFRINIFPVVLGGGKPLFQDITERASLRLLKATASASGVVESIYQPASQQ